MNLWIVDSFANKPFHGNPAAVALVNQFPEDIVCQNIAAEMNLSETVFVKKLSDNQFHIRWFTPTVEVDLCGHGTLAASHVLHEQGMFTEKEIVFESLSGPLRVTNNHPHYTLDFPARTNHTGFHITPDILNHFGPINEVALYGDDLVIEASSDDLVKNLKPDFTLIKSMPCHSVIYTAKSEGSSFDFISRFFNPKHGINEDPVTGFSHCILAPYWSKKLNKTEMLAHQASKRGGTIHVNLKGKRVLLTGEAVTVFEGRFVAHA